jgi:hypothetical protein
MGNPEQVPFGKCEKHDFRRIWKRDLNPDIPADQDSVFVVACCRCGCSPIRTMGDGTRVEVAGEWPEDLRIDAYYHSDIDGPSVEFSQR